MLNAELSQVDVSTREILVPAHERNSTNWPVLEDGTWPDAAAHGRPKRLYIKQNMNGPKETAITLTEGEPKCILLVSFAGLRILRYCSFLLQMGRSDS